MKKAVFLFIGVCLLFISFTTGNVKINWKKITTNQEAWSAMSQLIHTGDAIDADHKLLEAQKHSFIQQSGDSVIYFHSPEKSVHFGAIVTRKWMYTLHYVNRKLDNFVVEKGLTGP